MSLNLFNNRIKTALVLACLLFIGISFSMETSAFASTSRRISVRLVKKISLPKGYHEGLFFDGKNIWVCNGKGGKTWVIDTVSGSIVSDIKLPGNFTEGVAMTKDGTYWVTDWDDKKIYHAKNDNNKMVVEYERDIAPAHPTGVVLADKMFYVITWTRGPGGTKYHLMQISDDGRLFQITNIKGIPEPAHLTWDGKNLWIASWYNQRVYKIDINTFKILGSFRAPAADTTGLAWDGKHLWVTGTYAGLYQLEIR